jgi:hypothetical protein
VVDAEGAARPSGPARSVPAFYSDIANTGSLQHALQAEFDRADRRPTALPERAPGWRYVGARVEDPQRNTNIVMGVAERVFTMEFWSSGVFMARGNTADLPAVADARIGQGR